MSRQQTRGTLHITGDEDADRLLNSDPLALVVGMLLDQQVPMGWAFRGPATLRDRLGHLDPGRIASMSEDEFVEVCCRTPAIHRFPAAMGRRIHATCEAIVDGYDGDTAAIWEGATSADELAARLSDLPGFGSEKTMILIAVLAKRFGVRLPGWEEAAGPFADDQPRSAADVDGPESHERVKAWKRAQRAAGRTKQE